MFDASKLTDAHVYCKSKAKQNMIDGISPVVIDNTNVKIWEFKPYVMMAIKYDYEIYIAEPNTPW